MSFKDDVFWHVFLLHFEDTLISEIDLKDFKIRAVKTKTFRKKKKQ